MVIYLKNLFAIIAWKTKRYLSLSFHEYRLFQKHNQREGSLLFPRVRFHSSSVCSFVFYSPLVSASFLTSLCILIWVLSRANLEIGIWVEK